MIRFFFQTVILDTFAGLSSDVKKPRISHTSANALQKAKDAWADILAALGK